MKLESQVANKHEFKIPYKPYQTAWGPHTNININHKQNNNRKMCNNIYEKVKMLAKR